VQVQSGSESEEVEVQMLVCAVCCITSYIMMLYAVCCALCRVCTVCRMAHAGAGVQLGGPVAGGRACSISADSI
jgi:hypothetical protein